MKEIVCKKCGKTCPDVKFCIFCGALLEDPDKVFMERKFETSEECDTVKNDYETLTKKFRSDSDGYTLNDILEAISACEQGKYHPVASQLALDYLKPLAEDIQYNKEKKARLKAAKFLSYFDIALLIFIFLLRPIMSVENVGKNIIGLVSLLIPGKVGPILWIWNIIVLIVLAFAIYCMITFLFTNDLDFITGCPFIVPGALILICICNAVIGLLGVRYSADMGCWWSICSGILIGIMNLVILPKRFRK